MTLYFARKPMFDNRVLLRREITKYVTPKPRGGCEANANLDKHENPRTWGHLHQCLTAQRMWGHLHQCLVAPMRLQCWLATTDMPLLPLPFA